MPLVRLRAMAMQESVPIGAGAMAAILNLDDDKIREACSEAMLAVGNGEVAELVNFNGPGQTVIAGSKAAIERACDGCKALGAKRAVLLPVSAPFHSSLMRPAADRLASRLAELNFAVPAIPVVNNVDVAIEADPARIKDALVRQAYSPVRWVETVRKIAATGRGDDRRMRSGQSPGRPEQTLRRWRDGSGAGRSGGDRGLRNGARVGGDAQRTNCTRQRRVARHRPSDRP